MRRIYVVFLALLMAVIPLTTGCANQEQPTTVPEEGRTYSFNELVDIDSVEHITYDWRSLEIHERSGEDIRVQLFDKCLAGACFTNEDATVEEVKAEVLILCEMLCIFAHSAGGGAPVFSLYLNENGSAVLLIDDVFYVTQKSQPLDYDAILSCLRGYQARKE